MQGKFLCLEPCIPKAWPNYQMTLRYRSARYEILVENPRGVARGISGAEFDGSAITQWPLRLPLLDDGMTHRIHVTLG
jgi:cyclic beta-1,2-glucan synthetase